MYIAVRDSVVALTFNTVAVKSNTRYILLNRRLFNCYRFPPAFIRDRRLLEDIRYVGDENFTSKQAAYA